MTAILDYMRLCRLCLVKDKVNVPIFGEASEVRQIFLKITACLPVKVSEEDNLPKHICDSCMYKVDLLYQFWNTTVNAEKQLIQWLGEIGVDVNIKNTSPPNLRITPQSHAHPHSMPEAIILKEERPDPEMRAMETSQNYQDSQNMYSDYEMPYQPQVNMTVGAPTDFSQPTDAPAEEEVKVPQQKAQPTKPTPAKRRGRPPKQKTPPAVKVTPPPAPPAATSTATTATGSKRRSSAAAAAAAVAAAAAANASSDESDMDDRYGDDSDDEDMDVRIAKEEADSEDEEYIDNPESLEPTAFVGVPSTSACDSEQPGPSGLGGSTTTGKTSTALPASAANESGHSFYEDNKLNLKDPIEMEPIVTIVELPATTDWRISSSSRRKKVKDDDDNDSDYEPLLTRKRNKSNISKQKKTKVPKPVHRKIAPRKAKYEGYKNPFVYDHLNIKDEKPASKQKSKSKTKWTCLICSTNLTGKTELIDHYAAHKEDKIKVEDGETLTENEVYQCEVCLKEFTSEKRFEKHAETHNDSRFNCEYCEKSFKRPYEYAVHMRFHSNDDKLKCHVCDYTTTYNSALKTHIKRHEAEYKYKCELCDKGFFVYTWFEEHKNFHTGAKPFSCEICGKQFAYTRYLSAHKRSMHPESYGTQPVINECQFCQKRFAHKKSLLLHVRGHTGENTVLCDICGKRLSSNDHLKLHRRIHTGYKPYACTTCGKGFSKKCNLTLHERVHSGEKPYVCDVCGKCFSQRSTLVIHTRYHTGARPYICHLCNKGFVAKGVLSIHLKSCNRQNIIGNYLIEPIPKRE